MILRRTIALAAFCISLGSCGDSGLQFKVHFRAVEGLQPGAPVVYGDRPIGSVLAIIPDPKGGSLVTLTVQEGARSLATTESRFYLAESPGGANRRQIEIQQAKPGGQILAEGAIVEGSEPIANLIPFGDIFRQFSEGLRGMRDQVEQFQRDLQNLPDSEDGKRLQKEWRRLTEEIEKAQSQTEETVRKDLLPKLEAEMERLRERYNRLEPKSPVPRKSQQI